MTRRLFVEDLSEELALAIYRLTEGFPTTERYGLARELRRTAVSVGSNVAEGRGRRTEAEFGRHLDIALGSLRELEFQWRIARRLGYVHPEGSAQVEALVGRLAAGLLRLGASTRRR